MSVGYSKKPLVQKLGIKQGFRVVFLNPPGDYMTTIGELPEGVIVIHELKGELDFIQIFSKEKITLERKFPKLKECLKQNGIIWVSWTKASSNLRANLNERIVRDIGLKNGMVDVKICAIDETWSGLKFVRRLKDRL